MHPLHKDRHGLSILTFSRWSRSKARFGIGTLPILLSASDAITASCQARPQCLPDGLLKEMGCRKLWGGSLARFQ